ncbi:MAG TPA: FecR domain-containing protein [Dyella sp.]|uniref:FecR family protein n=1 Tax=Dyella sp. TaxID=1869338 RepID=UPI002F92386F
MNEPQRFKHGPSALRLAEQAASWYLDQRAGLSDAQQREFLAWLRRSPAHLNEYLAMAQLHGDLQVAATMEKLSADQLVELAATESAVVNLRAPGMSPVREHPVSKAATRRPRTIWLGALAACAVAAGAMTIGWLNRAVPAETYIADTTTVRSLSLPDGTLVQLDRASAIAVRFDAHARHIEILKGSAVFDVGHDAGRPLSVSVGRNVLRDIGTVFAVRRDGDDSKVTVMSGHVQILPQTGWTVWRDVAPLADLRSGEQATLDARGAVHAAAKADVTAATDWLPAEIRFQRDTVANVARRFNAYTTRPLAIEDAAVAQTRLTGVFHARDVDAFIAYLQTLPHVRVLRESDRVRVVAAEPSQSGPRL